jgi:hypothetical protein
MCQLGWFYASGQGGAPDYAKAREWYEKAAAKGDANSMFGLGLLYATGYNVAPDHARAREWYTKARTRYERAAANGEPSATTSLQSLTISEAALSERYPEALELQESLADKLEAAETKRDGKPGEETARALVDVVWYALLARKFTKALTVAERAHALLPDDLKIETNRAHALMFLGRGQESKALYLSYKGRHIWGPGSEPWEDVVAEDFIQFRKAGLTHPMMPDIEQQLRIQN